MSTYKEREGERERKRERAREREKESERDRDIERKRETVLGSKFFGLHHHSRALMSRVREHHFR